MKLDHSLIGTCRSWLDDPEVRNPLIVSGVSFWEDHIRVFYYYASFGSDRELEEFFQESAPLPLASTVGERIMQMYGEHDADENNFTLLGDLT